MKCKNKKICYAKHLRWKNNQEKYIPIGDQEHENFKELFFGQRKSNLLDYSEYFTNKRSVERSINGHDVEVVLKYGWVIERNFIPTTQTTRLVLLGYTAERRSLHVVIELYGDEWDVVTAYSPATKPYKWNNNYQGRLCFCNNDEE